MAGKEKKNTDLLASSMQQAVWNFVITMILQYRQTLSAQDAAHKTSDWLRALADKIDEQADASATEQDMLIDVIEETERENN